MTPPRRAGWSLAAVLAVATAAVVAGLRLGGGSAEHGFNSDGGISLLMANAETWTPFHLYYFGQDRFGALPFSVASLVHVVTGLRWTPFSLGFVQVIACLSGAYAFGKLTRSPVFFACAYAFVALTTTKAFHFDIAQPYGWQLPLIFAAWWCIRRAREEQSFARISLATAVVFLACWQSALSGPMLLGVAGIESLFGAAQLSWRRRLLVLLPALAGGGLEGALRGVAQVYAKRTFGHSFRTSLDLELEGTGSAFWHFADNGFGPGLLFIGLALTVFIVAGWRVLRHLRAQQAPSGEELLALTFAPLVVGQMLLLAATSHIRLNGLDPRYLNIAEVMAKLSVVVGLFEIARRVHRRGETALTAVALALIFGSVVWVKDPGRTPEPERWARIAAALTEGRASAPTYVISGYWEVYALAAMHPTGLLRPTTFENQYGRTPFNDRPLMDEAFIWVGAGGLDTSTPQDLDTDLLLHPPLTPLERIPNAEKVIEGLRFVAFRSAAHRIISAPRLTSCDSETLLRGLGAAEAHLLVAVRENRNVEVSVSSERGERRRIEPVRVQVSARQYVAVGAESFAVKVAAESNGRCRPTNALVLKGP